MGEGKIAKLKAEGKEKENGKFFILIFIQGEFHHLAGIIYEIKKYRPTKSQKEKVNILCYN